ncbi:hypothetical protein Gpo141_00002517 [Globisporangium polare]
MGRPDRQGFQLTPGLDATTLGEVEINWSRLFANCPKGTFAGHAFDLKFVRQGGLALPNHVETLEKILSLDIKLFDKHPEDYLVFTHGLDDDFFDDEEMSDQLDDTMMSVTFVCSPNKNKKSPLDCFDAECVVSKKAREFELA